MLQTQGASEVDLQKAQAILDKHIPQSLQKFLEDAGTKIVLLGATKYNVASPMLSELSFSVDDWPAPPAGLFVIAEKTVYVRIVSAMTIVHELGHALDAALGNGVYASGINPMLKTAYNKSLGFVTPYAASGLDEFFAENFRAYMNVNDAASIWPKVSPERLKQFSPTVSAFFEQTLATIETQFKAKGN